MLDRIRWCREQVEGASAPGANSLHVLISAPRLCELPRAWGLSHRSATRLICFAGNVVYCGVPDVPDTLSASLVRFVARAPGGRPPRRPEMYGGDSTRACLPQLRTTWSTTRGPPRWLTTVAPAPMMPRSALAAHQMAGLLEKRQVGNTPGQPAPGDAIRGLMHAAVLKLIGAVKFEGLPRPMNLTGMWSTTLHHIPLLLIIMLPPMFVASSLPLPFLTLVPPRT